MLTAYTVTDHFRQGPACDRSGLCPDRYHLHLCFNGQDDANHAPTEHKAHAGHECLTAVIFLQCPYRNDVPSLKKPRKKCLNQIDFW